MIPILIKTESAWASASLATVNGAGVTANVYQGVGNLEKDAPAIVCVCKDASEEILESGVWRVRTEIQVREVAADTDSQDIGSLADTVFSGLISLTPQQLQNCVSGFGVYAIEIKGVDNSTQDDSWCQTLTIETICVLT